MPTDMIYSQWFDRLRQNLVLSGFDPIDHDDILNETSDINTKKRPITTMLPPEKPLKVAPIAKKQKTSVSASSAPSGVPSLEKEDEGWIDELFQLDAQGIDVSPLSSLCENDDVTPPPPLAPAIASDATGPPQLQQQRQSMLSNVVSDVLAELTSDEEDSLLGEFSQSFLEEDKDVMDSVEGQQQEEEDFFSSSFQQTSTIPLLEGILPAPVEIPSVPLQQQQPPRGGELYDPCPFPPPPPSSVAPTPHTTPPPSSDGFSPPEGMSEVESTKFTIDSVKKCEEPMLLTLTSFPFRILYANEAYQTMTGNSTSIIGKTFYDIFINEGKEAPSFGACNGLLGKYQQDIVRVQSSNDENSKSGQAGNNKEEIYSTIKIRPILKKAGQPDAGLRYYAVTLKQLQVQNDSSIVYLPMPSGSMIKF